MKTKPHFLLTLLAVILGLHQAAAQDTVFTYQGQVLDNGTNFTGAGQFKFALVTTSTVGQQATAAASVVDGFVVSYTVTSGGSGYGAVPTVTISGGGGSGATAAAVVSNGVVTAVNANQAGSTYSSPPTVTIAPPTEVAYVTYWNNDGTASGEPSAAVAVPVNNGLFSVVLGDATLSNMTAISAALFAAQPNLQLRIWFNDGTNGFAALSPVQNLTPAPYATMAGTASNLLGTLPAGQVTGALSPAQLPGTVVTNNQNGVTLNGTFTGNGSGLTSLNASQLNSGTVPLAQLPGAVVTNNGAGVTLSGAFSGNGAGLTNLIANNLNLNATNLAGQIQSGHESTNTALLNAANTFTRMNTFANQTGANPMVLFAPTNSYNDSPNYVWQMAPASSNAYSANFNFNQEVAYFNGVPDNGVTWGWNDMSGAQPQRPGVAMLFWELEHYYQQTANQSQSECHLDYRDMLGNYDRPLTYTLDTSNLLNWGQNSALDSVLYRVPANNGTGAGWLVLTPTNSLWYYNTPAGLDMEQYGNVLAFQPAGTAPNAERLQFDQWSNIFFNTFGGSAVVESNGSFGVFSNHVASAASPVAGSLYLGDSTFNYQTQWYGAPGLSAVYDPSTGIASSLAFYVYQGSSSRTELMRMLHNGNVGIGTINPSASLAVNGNFIASGIVSATNGFASYATNTYTMNAAGYTNVGARNIQVFELTGTSILYSNAASATQFSLGSPTGTGVTFVLKPGCSVSGTGCAVAGMEDF